MKYTEEQQSIITDCIERLKDTNGCEWAVNVVCLPNGAVPDFNSNVERKFRGDAADSVCEAFGFGMEFMDSRAGRKRPYPDMRATYAYLVCTRAGSGLVKIAHLLGYKDHSTVIHCRDKHSLFVSNNREYRGMWKLVVEGMEARGWKKYLDPEGKERFLFVPATQIGCNTVGNGANPHAMPVAEIKSVVAFKAHQ